VVFFYPHISLCCCTQWKHPALSNERHFFCSKLLRFHLFSLEMKAMYQLCVRFRSKNRFCKLSAKKRKLKLNVCMSARRFSPRERMQPQEIALSGCALRMRSRPQFFRAANASLPTHHSNKVEPVKNSSARTTSHFYVEISGAQFGFSKNDLVSFSSPQGCIFLFQGLKKL
jgi:hypothetical protein